MPHILEACVTVSTPRVYIGSWIAHIELQFTQFITFHKSAGIHADTVLDSDKASFGQLSTNLQTVRG